MHLNLPTLRFTPLIAALLLLAGCAVNPVTGQRELALTSEQEEIAIGQQQYQPSQQMQGGIYNVDPGINQYINAVGQSLAAQSERQLPYEFVVLNNGGVNAWALPGGKLAINRGLLLELNDEAELAAVLGHEIVHAAARHSAKQMDRKVLSSIGVAAVGIASASRTDHAVLATGTAALAASLINTKYGRDAELESDKYGMIYMQRAGYDPMGAVDLQKTFVRLSEGKSSGGLFASHPPSQARVDANLKTAASMPRGGVRNAERYQAKIQQLVTDAPAYALYDEGLAILDKEDPAGAQAKADQAIALQGRESLFHELRGLSLAEQGKGPEALAAFDKAIALNDSYFSHYYYRGVLKQAMGDKEGAKADLELSYKLLPTEQAQKHLAELNK